MRTGVDIVEISRIEKILESRREKFYEKIFTGEEIQYIVNKKHNSKTISGIFATKEAVSKLLGSGIGRVNWKDIEVLHDKNGRPFIGINKKLEKYLQKVDLNCIDISISHERKYAISFAIGFKKIK